MKKHIFVVFFVVFCLLLTSCAPEAGEDVSRDDTVMGTIVSDIGVTDETKLVVKKPHDFALDCDVYLVYVEENGVVSEYTYEFYGTVFGHNDAMDYYDIRSVKKIYSVVSHDEDACMVCVVNTSVQFESISLLTEQYENIHYTDQGYEIIR